MAHLLLESVNLATGREREWTCVLRSHLGAHRSMLRQPPASKWGRLIFWKGNWTTTERKLCQLCGIFEGPAGRREEPIPSSPLVHPSKLVWQLTRNRISFLYVNPKYLEVWLFIYLYFSFSWDRSTSEDPVFFSFLGTFYLQYIMGPNLDRLQFGNFTAMIRIEGKPAQCYAVDVNKRKKQVTCWIASRVGQVRISRRYIMNVGWMVNINCDSHTLDLCCLPEKGGDCIPLLASNILRWHKNCIQAARETVRRKT